jgi:hypothetical protein
LLQPLLDLEDEMNKMKVIVQYMLMVAFFLSPGQEKTGMTTDSSATELVSLAPDGTQGNGHSFSSSITSEGRYVAFASEANNLVAEDTNNFSDIFVRDRQTATTERVSVSSSDGSQGNGNSY